MFRRPTFRCMAVTVAEVVPSGLAAGVDTRVWDVTATANGDTTATIPHGMPVAPAQVVLSPLNVAFYASMWVWTSDATNIVLTKINSAGGAGSAQVRVIARRSTALDR